MLSLSFESKAKHSGDPNPENVIKEPFKYQITTAGSLPRLYCALYFQAVKSVIQMLIWITDFLRFLNGGLSNRPFNNRDGKCLFWFGFKTVTTFCLVFFNLSLQLISVTKCGFYLLRTYINTGFLFRWPWRYQRCHHPGTSLCQPEKLKKIKSCAVDLNTKIFWYKWITVQSLNGSDFMSCIGKDCSSYGKLDWAQL